MTDLGKEERKEMLRQLGSEVRGLSEWDRKSVTLAISTFAHAYLMDTYARACGLTRSEYEITAKQVMETDFNKVLEGADAQRGLELMLGLGGCTEQGDVPGHIAPTQKGDAAIMYTIGNAMKK